MKFSDVEDMSFEDLVNNGVITLSIGAGPNFPTDLCSYNQSTCWSIQAMQSIESINSFSDKASSLVLDINDSALNAERAFRDQHDMLSKRKPEVANGSVYLIVNDRNGCVKIGYTAGDPKYRESTLQSEEPDISMICSFPNSTMKDELNLHEKYKKKRVRGEWFRLSDDDVFEIIKNQNEVVYHEVV
jgi:hypothetical protein